MKAKLISLIVLLIMVMSADAQVVFEKFKFGKDSPFGMAPTRKMTDMKYNVTGTKQIKKLVVRYVAVDQVKDAVGCTLSKAKKFQVVLTGPFYPGKSYSRWASGTIWYPHKITAFPYRILVDYMDDSSESIDINKDNISKYFPKLQWIDVNFKGIDLTEDVTPIPQETLVAENDYHPSFEGCRITPDSISFYPQNPSGIISFVFESKQPASKVFNNAKQWVAKTFSEYKDVVKMEDRDNHTLVFKGSMRQRVYNALFKNSPITYTPILQFTSTVECKDGRFRIKMEDFSIKENSTFLGNNITTEMTFQKIRELIDSPKVTSVDYKKFLQCTIEDAKENTAFLFNSLSTAMNTVDDF